MSPAEIYVHAQFPREILLGPGLDPNPTNWVWVHCLTIPVKTLHELNLSCRPYKWIRYAIGVVVGAQGHLSSRAHSLNIVDYDAGDLPTKHSITRLYYHLTDDDERRRMFPVSPEFERTNVSDVVTIRMVDFFEAVAERDGGMCPVTQAQKFCIPAHLLEHSKGDEYIAALTRARSRDPAHRDVIEDIDSVQNGIFLDVSVHAGLGSSLAFLLTPNFAMDTTDVDPSAVPGDLERYTVHVFVTGPKLYLGLLGCRPGTPIQFPNSDSPDWPPPILFDAVYAGAVLETFGTETMKKEITSSWYKTFYPSGTRDVNDEERFPHEDSRARRYPDQFDMLLAAPYTFIPNDRLEECREELQERVEAEMRRGVGKSIKTWIWDMQTSS